METERERGARSMRAGEKRGGPRHARYQCGSGTDGMHAERNGRTRAGGGICVKLIERRVRTSTISKIGQQPKTSGTISKWYKIRIRFLNYLNKILRPFTTPTCGLDGVYIRFLKKISANQPVVFFSHIKLAPATSQYFFLIIN